MLSEPCSHVLERIIDETDSPPCFSFFLVLDGNYCNGSLSSTVVGLKFSACNVRCNKLVRPTANSTIPRKYYVFGVTSIGQRSSSWTCSSVKVETKFHPECKLHFPCAQLMLRKIHLTSVSESMEAKH